MRIPQKPPFFTEFDPKQVVALSKDPKCVNFVNHANRKYLHWDKLRYQPFPEAIAENTPEGVNPRELAWVLVELSRSMQLNDLDLDLGVTPRYWTPPSHTEWLHFIDKNAAGSISSLTEDIATDSDRYLINSLMEEAIASSQLEGATTTRVKAKEMLRMERKPKDRAEQMIVNNYRAIQEIRDLQDDKLTPGMVQHIQEVITEKTLDDPGAAGRFRTSEENIVIADFEGKVVFEPPPADKVPDYVESICKFANKDSKDFVHPVIKAIAIHFAIGYTHPFVDGNGRTARALFYWYMLKHGYWLFEYLPISRIFLNAPVKYARAYLHTETDRYDLTYFSHYHLEVIVRAIKELHEYLATQAKKIEAAKELLSEWVKVLNHRQQDVVYDAVKHPGKRYTVKAHATTHNVTQATARSDLLDLADRNLFTKEKALDNKWIFTPLSRIVAKLKERSPKKET